jgi:type II secretory pathway pseudopilin PulG
MTFRTYERLNQNQRGTTLIELLVFIAISGIITTGAATAMYQLYSVYAQVSTKLTVNNQVQNAARWITTDSQMAQIATKTDASASKLPLTLAWNGWDSKNYQVTYSLSPSGDELQRTYSDGVVVSTIVIARYVDADPANTYCDYNSQDGVLTFQITSHMDGFRPQTATSLVKVMIRIYS